MSPVIPMLITAGIVIASMIIGSPGINTATNQTATTQNRVAQIQNNEKVVEYTIEAGDTFSSVMEKSGIAQKEIASILGTSRDVYDFTRIQAGRLLKLVFIENALAQIQYDVDDIKSVVVEKDNHGFEAKETDIQYDIEQASAGAVINTLLFTDASEAGLEAKTILELAEIFGWDIDFATDIREGDSFKVVYEKRSRDGKPTGAGKILAARFENQGQAYWAFYYKDSNGNEGYYNLDGQSLARQFLKSPLVYSYISSGFTYNRLHPVLKTVLPHRAIDYAAPAGTPVRATADGEITYAGWKGDNGIYVEVKHNGIYTTQYSHLSSVAKGMKRGVRVTQGQVVGYVGSTGISTGPHLQYAMSKNGSLVNPLTIELPAGESVQENFRDDFNRTKGQLKKLLD